MSHAKYGQSGTKDKVWKSASIIKGKDSPFIMVRMVKLLKWVGK